MESFVIFIGSDVMVLFNTLMRVDAIMLIPTASVDR